MQKHKLKTLVLLLGLLSFTTWQQAQGFNLSDGFSHINVKEAHVEGAPKGSSIQASIDGHYLTVSFTENLGQVAIEITTASGGYVETLSITTPNGLHKRKGIIILNNYLLKERLSLQRTCKT